MAQTMKRPNAQAPVINPRPARSAPWPVEFYRSAVGKKWVMAVSGLAMVGFLIAHLVGNLKVYLGMETTGEHAGEYAIDVYGEGLRNLLYPIMPHGTVLWIMRLGLIVALIAHVHAAATLTIMNRNARPTSYQSPRHYAAVNFASRSMRWTGLIVLGYIIFHLMDLTWGTVNPGFEHGAVYDNMMGSLQRWPVALVYMVCNIAVAVHLYHGTWSMFQSLGLNNPRYNAARKAFAVGVSSIIGIGNVLFPLLIVTGVVGK